MSTILWPEPSRVSVTSGSGVFSAILFCGRSITLPRNSSRFTLRMWGTASPRTVVSTMPDAPPRHIGKRMDAITFAAPPNPRAAFGLLC
eukprot:4272622-Pyramimonas_sp.AAC.1